MHIHVTTDPAGLVRATVAGATNPSAAEFEAFLDALTTDPGFRPGVRVLHDRRGVAAPPDPAWVRAAVGAIAARADRLAGCRWAFLVGPAAGLEVVRLSALLGEQAEVEARAFADEAEALGWLGRGGGPAPVGP